ncbi:MAG: exopolysaccharide biosynthesis protein [Polyangiaceae bacterium]
MNTTSEPKVSASRHQFVTKKRTSELLRDILTNNPHLQTFTIEQILASIGEHPEASLMMVTLPAIVPVPKQKGAVAAPAGALAYQLFSGEQRTRLPRFILRKSISRRALAVAIHAVLPVLEASEKAMRPRWTWINHSAARRAIACFVFLLALAIAFPLFGFTSLHATSIFVIALGMAEQDGLAVLVGAAVGFLSLALVASGASARALREKAVAWLRKATRKLGFKAFIDYLRRRGYERVARILTFEWSKLLLLWNPEKPRAVAPRVGAAARSLAAKPSAVLQELRYAAAPRVSVA